MIPNRRALLVIDVQDGYCAGPQPAPYTGCGPSLANSHQNGTPVVTTTRRLAALGGAPLRPRDSIHPAQDARTWAEAMA